MHKRYKLTSDQDYPNMITRRDLIYQGEKNAKLEDVGRVVAKLIFNGRNVDFFIWDFHADIPSWKLFGEYETFLSAEFAMIEALNIRDEIDYDVGMISHRQAEQERPMFYEDSEADYE